MQEQLTRVMLRRSTATGCRRAPRAARSSFRRATRRASGLRPRRLFERRHPASRAPIGLRDGAEDGDIVASASPGGASALRIAARAARCSLRCRRIRTSSTMLEKRRRRAPRSSSGRYPERSSVANFAAARCAMLLIGLRLRRILADDVERVELSAIRPPRTCAVRFQPFFCGSAAFQARSNFARFAGSSTSWPPGNLLGIAPMSPPPCTLFCPRSGQSPLP